jgi:hypothetical protein
VDVERTGEPRVDPPARPPDAAPVLATGSGSRLRLDGMLRELGAHDGDDAPPPRPDSIKVGELVDKAAQAGFGFLVAVLSLIAIPFVGLSTPFGLAIALVGVQLAVGRPRPWLPKRARKRDLSMAMLDRILALLARRTRWLARSARRRWPLFVTPKLVGVAIVLLSLLLALPLPIPGSNLIFIVPLMIYAVGLLEGDGMWIVVAHVATVIDIGLVIAFGATVVSVLARVWNWIF